MKPLLIAVLSLGLVASACAEDAPKKEKSAPAPPGKTYQPLIIPGGPDGNTTPVPQPGKDLPGESDKDEASGPGPESSTGGRMPLPIDAGKEKKQELWIYTLPDEEAARKKQQREEEREMERVQEIRKTGQLPDWAVDPEFRKYFLEQDPQAVPGAGTQGRTPFDMGLDWKTPRQPGEDSESDSPDEEATFQGNVPLKGPDQGLFPTGTSLNTGKAPFGPDESGGAPTRPSDERMDYDRLYQSNQKQKRVEDFHDGLNKPMEVEKSSDRYHKPQKPQ